MTINNWKTFKTEEKHFKSKVDYEEYMEHTRCAICHKKLKIGEKFDLRPIQSPEQAGGLTVQAVIVHKGCIDENTDRDTNTRR